MGHRDGHVIRLGNVPSHSCNISDADRQRIPLLVGGTKAQAHRGVCQEGGGNAAAEEECEDAPPDVHDRSGALTGEAFYGVEAAILAVLDEISLGGELLKTYFLVALARLAGFVIINVLLGMIVYVLFRKAGIIGGSQ